MSYRYVLLIGLLLVAAGCVQISPRYMKGTEYERALFLYENGRLEEALKKADSIPRESADYKYAKRLITDISSAYMTISRRHADLADDLEKAGIYGAAIEEYRIVLRYNPSNALAKGKIASLTEALDENRGADNKRVVRERKRKDERDEPEYQANLHYMKGKMYYETKEWGRAVEELSDVLKLVPVYMNTEELLVKAKKERDRAVERLIKSGISYFQSEEMEFAIREWDSALDLDPGNKTAADYRSRAEAIMERLKNIREKQEKGPL